MAEIVWQYDKSEHEREPAPASARRAQEWLEAGNRGFADLIARPAGTEDDRRVLKIYLEDLGISEVPGKAPKQKPFAAVLSCADARVPTGLLFSQAVNDLFAVRVAGNVLASSCLGSLDYAVENLESVRLLVVLGHTDCGAVTAAVDSMQTQANYIKVAVNQPLRVIVDSLIPIVGSAENTLKEVYGLQAVDAPGYRGALIEMAVTMNAAMIAGIIQRTYHQHINDNLGVVYGVYNLQNRLVGRPDVDPSPGRWQAGLFTPPQDEDGFVGLASQLAGSSFIQHLLSDGSA